MRPDLIIRGQRVALPETIAPRSVHIREERIVFVGDYMDVVDGCEVVDAGESVVMPGLVDTHVHVNEPGRTEWEGFRSATLAAAAGGVVMPAAATAPSTTIASASFAASTRSVVASTRSAASSRRSSTISSAPATRRSSTAS